MHMDSVEKKSYLELPNIRWARLVVYFKPVALASTRRLPEYADRSLGKRRGLPSLSLPEAELSKASTRGTAISDWSDWWYTSSPC